MSDLSGGEWCRPMPSQNGRQGSQRGAGVTSWRCTVVRDGSGPPVILRLIDGEPADRWNRETQTWQPIEENEC
jgi:hypothetical protein